MAEGFKIDQQHGKSRIRVARVWKNVDGSGDVIVEWNVAISLFSDCLPAYTSGDNSAIVATDSMKNTVYAKAKECTEVISMEGFAILLGRHFASFYPQVSAAVINIVEKPWERVDVDGRSHSHGELAHVTISSLTVSLRVAPNLEDFGICFRLGSEKHTTEVKVEKYGTVSITSGIEGLALLKTTQMLTTKARAGSDLKEGRTEEISGEKDDGIDAQNSDLKKSGFEGFVRDHFTLLPETRERMVATEVTASWRYSLTHISDIPAKQFCFTERYLGVKKVLVDTFFGPPVEGVYSPSVQNTLYLMAKDVLNRFPDITSVKLRMPNIHFLPVNLSSKDKPNLVKFADDVYMPIDEPHGTIEATLSRTMSRL
ncbi:hypothetical protein ZIOFF_014795 [Zingiber officinale]|uniref:factor independent urate hydroxylase n=1 Tax=Zingiber officinale TaxID=94328 RepID=A0A8J5LVT8_ZINOF|nr:hypothetical protein ZIOFF_014795 [Zingiber officinale]